MPAVDDMPETDTSTAAPLPKFETRGKEAFSNALREVNKLGPDNRPLALNKKAPETPPVKVEPTKEGEAAKPPVKAETVELPSNLSPKASENFKKLMTERDEWRKKHETESVEWTKKHTDLETRLKKYETDGRVDPDEHIKTKKQLEEYEGLVKQIAIERDPRFKAAYDDKISAAIKEATDVLGKDGVDVADILALPPSKQRDKAIKGIIEELGDKLGNFEQMRFVQILDRLTGIQRERQAEVSKAGESFAVLQKQQVEQQARAQAEAKENQARMHKAILGEIKSLPVIEGVDAKEVTAHVEKFVKQSLSDDFSTEEAVKLPAKAAFADYLVERVISAKDGEIKKLTEQLASYQSSMPGLSNAIKLEADGGKKVQRQLSNATGKPFIEKMRELRE